MARTVERLGEGHIQLKSPTSGCKAGAREMERKRGHTEHLHMSTCGAEEGAHETLTDEHLPGCSHGLPR